MILIPGLLDISDSDSNFDSSQKWNHSRTRIVHLPHKLYKWSNLMLMWAHLPVQYTVIGVSGKWLVIPCKCTTRYTVAKFQVASYYFLNYELLSGMNYYPVWFLVKSTQTDGQTDGQTESDAYEPIVQNAQVGSKKMYTGYWTTDLLITAHLL